MLEIKRLCEMHSFFMAERAGFEPAVGFPTTHFECVPLSRFGTSPEWRSYKKKHPRSSLGCGVSKVRVGYEYPYDYPKEYGKIIFKVWYIYNAVDYKNKHGNTNSMLEI